MKYDKQQQHILKKNHAINLLKFYCSPPMKSAMWTNRHPIIPTFDRIEYVSFIIENNVKRFSHYMLFTEETNSRILNVLIN